jgi:hypothetical protein
MNEFIVGESVSIRWPVWSEEMLEKMRLTHIEMELDGIGLAGIPPLRPIPSEFYECPLPAAMLTIGEHTLRARACRGDVGEWVTTPISITPIAPGLLRSTIHAPAVPVTVEEGIAMANAYAILARGVALNAVELNYLASQFIGPPTRAGILAFLDREYLKLVKL